MLAFGVAWWVIPDSEQIGAEAAEAAVVDQTTAPLSAYESSPPEFAAFDQASREPNEVEASVTYPGCNEVRALGLDPLYAGQPGYRTTMDGDLDGIACEPIP
ncbi:excalibur calcium-binding domain-containing protein [Tsuneonella sp. HG222]